jgi:hypothetical protein
MKKKKKNATKKLPDLAYLRQNYTYDPIKGHLYHADYQLDDKPAGYKDQRGYHHIRINRKTYKLHRIVFYMFHGRDPGKKVIDHINGDKGDNRILNLRAVTHRQNSSNTKASREKGVLPALEPQAWKVLAMTV